MKVSLHGLFLNVTRDLRTGDKRHVEVHALVLEELEQNIRATIRGEHSLREFAEHYCLADEIKQPEAASS